VTRAGKDHGRSTSGWPKLQAEAVTLRYDGLRHRKPLLALDRVSLTVDDGEFVSIVGPSGCGKTSFLYVVDGLIVPSAGTVRVDGMLVSGPGVDRAVVFQSDSLLPWRTVLGNVTYGLELRGMRGNEARDRARMQLELVGLSGFEQVHPHELSGGMRQRVNLARALACEPAVLLLDEPFSALDAQTRETMQVELAQIWSKARTTSLFVTHQIREAVFLSDRVVVFAARPGRVQEDVLVDLPRPRSLDIMRTSRFLELEDHIWHLIANSQRSSSLAVPQERPSDAPS
jgi:NitT/TauT family transport system ATP-binding protein